MCGTVVGCGEGHCDSTQFQEHIANCRLASKGKSGKMRYPSDNGETQ
jgi:hypothetical protein